MAYQALYRKYRPKTFSDVIGQEHITETLSKEIETGKLSHAYLFTGSRGTGKTSTAKIFAKAVNCEPKRIAKTLSFKVENKPILIVVAGDAKIDNAKYKAEFSKKGDWEKIEFYLGIPETLLPENVLSTLRQNFSDKAIVSVERNKRGYELTLVDATEVDISEEGKILEIDSEHPHKKFDKDKSDRAMKFKESKNDNSSKLDSVNPQ